MAKRDFLAISDFTTEELYEILERAHRLKAGADPGRPLAGKTLAMIFLKSSTRTRVSFEVAALELGGHALFLSARDIQLGRGEPIADTARVLSRYVDAILFRGFGHADVEALARHASVPVINGLTDLLHPCQVLADLMTVQEAFGRDLSTIVAAWIGDGNNVANAWLDGAVRFGYEMRLACPEGYEPDRQILERAKTRARVRLVRNPSDAVGGEGGEGGAHVVATDVWASMGQDAEVEKRRVAFQGYSVDRALMERARRDAIFLHCLPAHRGEEVAADVIDGPRSRVWDEAENRLHVQKALLMMLLQEHSDPWQQAPR